MNYTREETNKNNKQLVKSTLGLKSAFQNRRDIFMYINSMEIVL